MTFSTFQIEKILNIKRQRLQKWLELGFVQPSIQRAQGQGTRNRFTREDLYRLEIFKMLSDKGLLREAASGIIKYMDLSKESDVHSIWPDPLGSTAWMGRAGLVENLVDHTLVVVINLNQVRKKVDQKIQQVI